MQRNISLITYLNTHFKPGTDDLAKEWSLTDMIVDSLCAIKTNWQSTIENHIINNNIHNLGYNTMIKNIHTAEYHIIIKNNHIAEYHFIIKNKHFVQFHIII